MLFNSQASEARAILNVERSRFFPELSIGYSRQDILPLKNLNAWMVGVSFPIYFLPQKSRIKQAKLAVSAAQIQAEANIRELNNKITELSAALRRYEESLRFYTSMSNFVGTQRGRRTGQNSQLTITTQRNRYCGIYPVGQCCP